MSRKKILVVDDSADGAEQPARSRCARREESAVGSEKQGKIRARIPRVQVNPTSPRRLRTLAGGVPDRPLRILMLGSLPPPIGGTTVMLQQLVGELRDRPDVEVEVVDTCDAVCARGLHKLAAAARVAWRALRRIRWAEVVVLHASPPATVAFGPILYAITRILRRPMILREFGGSLDAEYRAMSRVKRQLLRIAFRSDQVLLETHHLIEAFRHELPRANCQWYANSRPVSKRPAPPASRPTGRFVFIGQVKPTKGIFDVLEAVKISHPNIRVDVYGPLMDGLTNGALPTEGRFRYRGVLEREAIPPTLRRYDAVLLPTHHCDEGYPGIILEAAAAGRPVIASRLRPIPEIVEDGVSGILIPPHDPKALARAMASLVSSPSELQRISEGAREFAMRFSSVVWTDRLVDICRSCSRPRQEPSFEGLSRFAAHTFHAMHQLRRCLMPNRYLLLRPRGMAYRLYLNLRESDLMWARFRGRYEVQKTRFLQGAIKSGMTVVDIGVNKGYFTLMAAALVGDQGRVHSFEPASENCSWIRKSVAANGFGNISLHQMALSDTEGETVLNLATTSGGHSILDATHARTGEAVSVATDTLDNVLSQHGVESIDVVKIDCEGAEMLVLRGAHDVFRKSERISVAIDIHPHYGIRPTEVIDWLTGNGFAVFDAGNRPIRLDEITDESAITEVYAVKPPVASLR